MDPGSALALLACPGRRGCDGMIMASRSRGMICPRFAGAVCPSSRRGSRECRVRAAPAVSCARLHKGMRTRAYRFSGGNPAFPAQWLYGLYRALLGDEFVLSPSLTNEWPIETRLGLKASASLAPATGART